jgi:tetratricopeptide (TPR) repeat protein
MRHGAVPSFLALAAVLGSAPAPAQIVVRSTASAQVRLEARARQTADSAQKLETGGKAPQAVELLSRERGTCGAGAAGRTCRQILDYTLGYVLQQSSARSTDPGAALRRAAAAYEKVLAEEPGHGPTLANLADVWQRLGEPQRAVPFLERAIAVDSTASATYAIQLGDLRLQSGALREAREVYSRILSRDPDNMVACNRLVMSHELAPDAGSVQTLLHWGETWERTVPDAARDAYEAVIRIAHRSDAAASETAASETALVRWVDLQGRAGGLSPYDLERLPATWDAPALQDLQTWLKQPEQPLPPASWWRQREERTTALARVALGLGREQEGRGAPEKAEAIWRFGRELATASETTRIDLQTELALLFFHHPELDPDGSRFRAAEGELFDAKIMAITRVDRAAIQRYHEALGLIYAEQGNWGSRGNPHSGLFQLQNAVDTAAERESAENLYQPQPFIRERLADGYLATGATELAVSAYLGASRAYLDVDDFRKAEMMIATARRLSTARDAADEISRLDAILSVRRRLATGAEEPSSAPPLARTALAEIEQSAWLAPTWQHPMKDFGARQRFKAFADLAVLASRGGAFPEIALGQAAQAMDMALKRQVYLVGAGDLLRLEHVQAIYAAPLGLAPEEPLLLPAGGKADGALPIALAAGGEPAFVRVSTEAALASHLVRDLGVDTVLEVRPQILIHDRNILIRKAEPGTDMPDLLKRMTAIEGVDNVGLAGTPLH